MCEKSPPERKLFHFGVGATASLVFLAVLSLLFLSVGYFMSQTNLGMVGEPIGAASCPKTVSNCRKLFDIWSMSMNQRVFEWGLFSTKVLFWISMTVSMSGIAFSFLQFSLSLESTRESSSDEMSLATGMFSFMLRSRTMASLVMFSSIAYLVIYVVFVYPVKVVEIPTAGQLPTSEVVITRDAPEDTDRVIDAEDVKEN